MKDLTENTIDLARTALTTVPPIVLFMGAVVAVLVPKGLELLAMVQNAG
tara:strand:+ start:7889 stop:8035 length:147 start_codon:yes stop_codon:yes gene_type:complete